jgi:hypothetical protein
MPFLRVGGEVDPIALSSTVTRSILLMAHRFIRRCGLIHMSRVDPSKSYLFKILCESNKLVGCPNIKGNY